MDDLIYDALVDLKSTIDKQNQTLEETNACMRAINERLASLLQMLDDMNEQPARRR